MVLPLDQSEQLAGYGVPEERHVRSHHNDNTEIDNSVSFCEKPLECGHTCKGPSGEHPCILPCLKEECQETL